MIGLQTGQIGVALAFACDLAMGTTACCIAGIVGGVCAGIGAGIGALAYGVCKAGKAIGRLFGFGREENTLSRQPENQRPQRQREQEEQNNDLRHRIPQQFVQKQHHLTQIQPVQGRFGLK